MIINKIYNTLEKLNLKRKGIRYMSPEINKVTLTLQAQVCELIFKIFFVSIVSEFSC